MNIPFPLHYSRITAFDCPWYGFSKYYLEICKFLDVDPDPDGPKPTPVGVNTQCGKFGHIVIKDYTEKLQEKNIQNSPGTMRELFFYSWHSCNLPESEYDDLEWCLTHFAESHLFNPEQIYGIEMPMAFKWESPKVSVEYAASEEPPDELVPCKWDGDHENIPGDTYICGILDLCEMPDPETLIITDYKFAWAAKNKTDLQRDLQGRIYCWLMSLVNPAIKNYIVRFDYVRKGIVVDLEYTPDEVASMAERVSRISTRIETDIKERGINPANWPASPCDMCQYCLFKCPSEGNRYQVMKTIDEYGGPESLGQKILELDTLRKRYNDVMKAYTKHERPVRVSGQEFGYHMTEKETYDAEAVYEKIMSFDDSGICNPFEILEVNTAKLNAKKRERTKAAVADLAKIKRSQRYGIEVTTESIMAFDKERELSDEN